MNRLLFACAAAGLMSSPAAQAQDGTAVFRPTGGWTADFGEDYCRLVRTFSDGKDEISLALERTQPGVFLRVLLVGNGVSTFRGADQIGYTLLPAGTERETRYVRSETANGQQFLGFEPLTLAPFTGPGPIATTLGAVARPDFSGNSPGPAARGDSPAPARAGPPPYRRDAELETARGINAVALDKGLTDPVRFETGSLRAPVEVMQACADDLLIVWGLDVEKHKTMTAGAILNPVSGGVLPQGTIPFTEFGKLGGGANQVRVLIGADGKPTSCVIYSPSLSETLNRRICSLVMDKATFQPAKDAGGQAMASFWMGSPFLLGPPFPGGGRGGLAANMTLPEQPVPISDLPPFVLPAVPAPPPTPAPAPPTSNS